MNFYLSHAIALQKLSNECSYKFSWILTLTEVISIRILRMLIISAIMNFYWSHDVAPRKLSNECSYKFSWILTFNHILFFFKKKIIRLQTDRYTCIPQGSSKYWLHVCYIWLHIYKTDLLNFTTYNQPATHRLKFVNATKKN